jgi:hypothetical protein
LSVQESKNQLTLHHEKKTGHLIGFGQKGCVPTFYGDLEIKITTSVLL